MKKCIYFILAIIIPTASFSQKVQFDIIGKVNRVVSETSLTTTVSNANSTHRLNDSIVVLSSGLFTRNYENNYSGRIGYDLNGRLKINLSNNFSVSTGLGLHYNAFSQESKYTSGNYNVLSSDTVFSPIVIGPPIISFGCDSFENSYSDLGEIDNTIYQNVLNLVIPLGIEYSIVRDVLSIEAGMLLQTPIASVKKSEYILSSSRIEEGVKICRYDKIEEKNTSGSDLNNLVFAFSANVSYQVLKEIRLELGVKKMISNIYASEQSRFSSLENSTAYKPLVLSAGISYQFGRL